MSAIATRPETRQPILNSATLVRLLGDLGASGPGTAGLSFAERLGHWLNWTDAIALSAAMVPTAPRATGIAAPEPAHAPAPAPAPAHRPATAEQDLASLRADITRAITTDPIFHPSPAAPAPADLVPYRLRHNAHQRSMGSRIDTLRARLRQTMAAGPPAQARLAALDAVLDDALAQRERSQLASVPGVLARRQAQLQQQSLEGWQAVFGREMQAVLLAELELRLQPALGLVAAMAQAATTSRGPATGQPATLEPTTPEPATPPSETETP